MTGQPALFDDTAQLEMPATRAEALRRLAAFQPAMGSRYAAQRNTDFGSGDRHNVSVLSPYIRRRLITEAEVIAAALDRFKLATAEKFVQEVVWRSYFKGWLEMRPSVWADYRAGVPMDRADLSNATLADLAAAKAGRTGIAAFDGFARELVETGYLHNHARMWVASIWIFTLRLPWRLGADFFLRHLLDGDAASNTLSWRWVAGLHTVGKHYVARAANISKHTDGRFPDTPGLAINPPPLVDGGNPARQALRAPLPHDPSAPSLALLTEDEGCYKDLPEFSEAAAVAVLDAEDTRSDLPVAAAVRGFDRAALADAAARLGRDAVTIPSAEALVAAAQAAGARQILTIHTPVGWRRDWLEAADPVLAAAGLHRAEIQRPWDAAFWPHATAGFFKVKDRIPATLRALGYAV